MKKIVDINSAIILAHSIKKRKEKLVLVGGCFDILHIGHIKFLESSKKLGDYLFIFLEPDEKVKKLKGENRPIFNQMDRAEALSHLKDVDVIVTLPYFSDDSEYKKLVLDLQPEIIAVTENDHNIEKKTSQAEILGGKLIIIPFVASLSSSKLAEILKSEKNY